MAKKKLLEEKLGFCSFDCKFSDEKKAMHLACLRENGVYCRIRKRIVEKGSPCADYSAPKRQY